MNGRPGRRASRMALAAASGAVLVAVAATPAAAADVTIEPGKTGVFATFFFGRSTICVKNRGDRAGFFEARTDAGYFEWRQVDAGQTKCLTRGWAGFRVSIKNTGQTDLNAYNIGL